MGYTYANTYIDIFFIFLILIPLLKFDFYKFNYY